MAPPTYRFVSLHPRPLRGQDLLTSRHQSRRSTKNGSVSYRDDRDALIAQNEQLQAELVAARAEIARLRGDGSRASGWLGGPTRIEIERQLEGELSESAIEEFVGMLRSRFGVTGRIERLGSTISWSTDIPRGTGGRNLTAHFTRRADGTLIRIEERLGTLAGGLFGGIVGGLGGAGFVNLLVWGIILANVWLLLGSVSWVALVFGIVRAAFGGLSKRRARELERLGAELEQAASDAIAASKRPNVRIADELDASDDEGYAQRRKSEEA